MTTRDQKQRDNNISLPKSNNKNNWKQEIYETSCVLFYLKKKKEKKWSQSVDFMLTKSAYEIGLMLIRNKIWASFCKIKKYFERP